MTIAIRTDTVLSPTITQQSLLDGIKAAFLNAGFTTPFDDYTAGTDRILVYAVVLDATKLNGTTYLRIRISAALGIFQQLYSGWIVATKVGANGSTEIAYTVIATGSPVNFVALKANPEFCLVMLSQGANIIALGFISPANRPAWWDLAAWNYCFIPIANTFATLRSTLLNPFANAENDLSLNFARMVSANIQTNRRDLLPGLILYTQTNQGITGRTSDDLVSVAASGTSRYDILQVPGSTAQYLILNPNTGGLAVRVA